MTNDQLATLIGASAAIKLVTDRDAALNELLQSTDLTDDAEEMAEAERDCLRNALVGAASNFVFSCLDAADIRCEDEDGRREATLEQRSAWFEKNGRENTQLAAALADSLSEIRTMPEQDRTKIVSSMLAHTFTPAVLGCRPHNVLV